MSINGIGLSQPVPQIPQTARAPAANPDLMALMVAARPQMEAVQRTAADKDAAADAQTSDQAQTPSLDVYL
jgi:hypothetical protein